MQPVILGFLLGAAVGLINFGLLVRLSDKVADMEAKKAGALVMFGYLLRIVLYGGAVIAAVVLPGIDPLATGGGILLVALVYTIRYTIKASK